MYELEQTMSIKGRLDGWVWKDEEEKLYTVRFAYKKLQNCNKG